MRSSTKVAWLAVGCAGIAAGLWSSLPEQVRNLSMAPRTPAPETSSAVRTPIGALEPGSTAALDAATVPTRNVPDKPQIRGYLINSTSGQPLKGYSIELRRRNVVHEVAERRGLPVDDQNTEVFSVGSWMRSINELQPASVNSPELMALMRERMQKVQQAATGAESAPSEPTVNPESVELAAARVRFLSAVSNLNLNRGEIQIQTALFEPPTAAVPQQEESAPEPQQAAPGQAQIELPHLEVQPLQINLNVGLRLLTEFNPGQVMTITSQEGETTVSGQYRLAISERGTSTAIWFDGGDQPGSIVSYVNGANGPAVQPLSISFLSEATPPDTLIATAVTDERGFFAFDCPDCPSETMNVGTGERQYVFLRLVPQEHDFVSSKAYVFSRPETMCSEEFDWRVAISGGSVLRGRVLDAKTTAPLERIRVELRGEHDCVEQVFTDEEGRFESTKTFPAGHLSWTLSDETEEQRIAVVPDQAEISGRERVEDELVLLATVGPTWRLRFQQSSIEADTEGKRVITVAQHDNDDVQLRLVGAEPWPGWEGTGNPFAEWRDINGGDPSWVRYPVAPKVSRGVVSAEFRTSDQAWAASVTLGDPSGSQEITLEQTAKVHGRVKLEGEADASAVLLRACRGNGGAEAVYEQAYADSDGSFEIEGLDVNAVRCLEIVSGGVVVRRLELSLVAAEDRELEIGL